MQQSKNTVSNIESIILRHGEEGLMRYLEIIAPSDGNKFISRLYQELASIVQNLEETAQYRQNDSEDRITSDVVLLLRQSGYDATHDTDHRGHVDIRVKNKTFVWLGEAKIHSNYSWLLDGLKQLHMRYSTGKEEGSGILIYIKGSNAKRVMDEWRKRLEADGECNLKETNEGIEKLTFWSIHQHEGSGLEISTKHIGVSLFYNPQK
jgi:hypothetical protein